MERAGGLDSQKHERETAAPPARLTTWGRVGGGGAGTLHSPCHSRRRAPRVRAALRSALPGLSDFTTPRKRRIGEDGLFLAQLWVPSNTGTKVRRIPTGPPSRVQPPRPIHSPRQCACYGGKLTPPTARSPLCGPRTHVWVWCVPWVWTRCQDVCPSHGLTWAPHSPKLPLRGTYVMWTNSRFWRL